MNILSRFSDKSLNVTFIGSGNLAWHLAPALDNVDFPVREVYSRNAKHATALAERLYQAEVKKTLDFSNSHSRIFILCVSDDAIEKLTLDSRSRSDERRVGANMKNVLALEIAARGHTVVFADDRSI